MFHRRFVENVLNMNLNSFHQITEKQFIDSQLDVMNIEENSVLFTENSKLDYIYFLLNGEVTIRINKHTLWSVDKKEFIGISSYFTGEKNYTYTVEASKNSTIVKINVDDFKEAIENSTELSTFIMDSLCERIKLTLKD
ncbi:MAG: cyclic nucleotide-binding domain-containing protein [Fluviicola sp.]|nr:cyclic nucleotide-binding domain-containing protein [Fluviicola sp.]